jgi:ribosome-binding ATPase YchF (GTP1/OBG family)
VLQVVRAFDDSNVHHVSGSIDPKRDIEIINTELIIADLETLEKRIGDNAKKARSGDKEAKINEEIFARLKIHLESGKIASLMDLTDDEKKSIYDLHLLTAKPFVYAVNVAEDKVNTPESELRSITGITDSKIPVLPVSAKIEMDMIEFSPEEKKEFLAEM